MTIDIGELFASGSRNSNKTERPEASTAAGPPGSGNGGGASADEVRLTAQVLRLRELETSLGLESAFDIQRVAALRDAIDQGDYRVNSPRLAAHLLAAEAELFS